MKVDGRFEMLPVAEAVGLDVGFPHIQSKRLDAGELLLRQAREEARQFTCGGETTMCTAGTLVHVPAGTVHAFSYGPGGGEMLEVTGRRSKAVGMFTALNREIPPGPPDVWKVIQVLGEHGVTGHI